MKAKRLIAVVMAFLLIFGNAFSVNAVGIIGEMVTDISGLNRLTISAALNDYFASREAFLLNQSDTINVPLIGVVEDEAAHRQKYESEDIIYVGSSISIGEVSIYDTNADAEVTETVTYMKDGVTNTANVAHKLFLGLNADNVPVVISDRYYESFSNFRSCSYVDESRSSAMNAEEGSSSCIAHVAWNELGESEGENGSTKYGAWYEELYSQDDDFDFTNAEWCVMFVSWCAAKANISESIIYRIANERLMRNFFIDQKRYYPRSEAVNSLSPNTGDLVFFTEDGVNPSHIGIVYSANNSYIKVVHGNWPDTVIEYDFNRTDSYILGYAKPAYANTGHTGYTDVAEEFYYDSTEHWVLCVNCWHECENEPHDITYTTTLTKHKASCSTCTYVGNWETHDTGSYESDETHHWKVCSTCNQQVDREKHHFKEVLYGRVYMCIDCAYESDSPNDAGIDVEVE